MRTTSSAGSDDSGTGKGDEAAVLAGIEEISKGRGEETAELADMTGKVEQEAHGVAQDHATANF